MTVIYAVPGHVPGVAAQLGLRMTWTGPDGSVWDLGDPTVSGLEMGRGVQGLGMPPVLRYESESPAVDGRRFRGHKIDARPVMWPLTVLHDSKLTEWIARDAAFWATMRPDAPGSWAVQTPDGATRSLLCSFVEVDDAMTVDPTLSGWAAYGIRLVADEEPCWTGSPVVAQFASGELVDFIDESGAPPFYISAGDLFASASITNPGDVEAYPVWRVDGPVTDVELGVGDSLIEAPITLNEGEFMIIDSRPTAQTAIKDDGTEVTSSLGSSVEWVAIPPGQSVPLDITVTGTGSVRCTITPRYMRAW